MAVTLPKRCRLRNRPNHQPSFSEIFDGMRTAK